MNYEFWKFELDKFSQKNNKVCCTFIWYPRVVLFIEDECEDEINKKEGVNFFSSSRLEED